MKKMKKLRQKIKKWKDERFVKHVVANAMGTLFDKYIYTGEIFATATYTEIEYEKLKELIQEVNERAKKTWDPFEVILNDSELTRNQVIYRYLNKPIRKINY